MWQSSDVTHAFGLPDIKPKIKGTLTLDDSKFTFTSKYFNTSIPRNLITAVSAGSDRVELWGTGGTILRMAIPEGGGLAAAAVMHHRVDMLTVEFADTRGERHSAVFYLPAGQADLALQRFGTLPHPQHPFSDVTACGANSVDPRSVYVEMPDWDRVEVPAAYRALVYEHVIARLKAAKGAGRVYRVGDLSLGTTCPQFTIKIAIDTYRKGNQVVRAATGPIGMFTGATQMGFDVTYKDAVTGAAKNEQIKASVRTQSESTAVADAVAKKLAKQYNTILRSSVTPAKLDPNTHS
ncbi:hypothetical protein [Silvibacterium acidisoli]|uniref:hypothetical protein n=1 Tax=Acidobacteriaceae bacterium ZG23-2 TaxID=2883246 RepID=UPI00406C7EAC